MDIQQLRNLVKRMSSQLDSQESKYLPHSNLISSETKKLENKTEEPMGNWSDTRWIVGFHKSIQEIRHLSPNTRHDQRMQVYQQLANLGQNFIYTAKTYGKIIISEVYLEPDRKTIKPLEGKGFAGGDKYYIHGIYFKFAVDSNGLYGGDERAMKVAGEHGSRNSFCNTGRT
jgi:hypothetical protein